MNVDLDLNFTVPPDYTAGTPLDVTMLAYSRIAPCGVNLKSNWVYAARARSPELSDETASPSEIGVDATFTSTDIAEVFTYQLDPAAGFEPGDTISFGVSSSVVGTFCDLVVTGVIIQYEEVGRGRQPLVRNSSSRSLKTMSSSSAISGCFASSGSASTMANAASRACSTSLRSRRNDANFKSLRPF